MNLRKRSTILALLAVHVALAGCSRSEAPVAAAVESPAELHFEAGRSAASPDFPGLASLCDELPPEVTAERVIASDPQRPEPAALAPTRVFDNLLFVGNRGISAWAIETSDGLILIDALANARQAESAIEGGLRELGLDPADIRILVISHGHGDHYGGAEYLLGKYDMQVIMSEADWRALENPDDRINSPGWFEVPTPDRTIVDRELVTLGDVSLELVVTPSHTPGTLASIFAVHDGDTQHNVVLWGGTGYNFGPYPERLRTYAKSAEAMRLEVLEHGYDVLLSNHANRDRAHEKIAALALRQAGEPHPFVMSAERVARGFEVFRECALGHAAALAD